MRDRVVLFKLCEVIRLVKFKYQICSYKNKQVLKKEKKNYSGLPQMGKYECEYNYWD